MKFYAVAVLLVICVVQHASADWRGDLKEKHVSRLSTFVRRLTNILKFIAYVKNSPAAWTCIDVANGQFADLVARHQSEIDQCIAVPAEEPQATKCCDGIKKNAFVEATSVSNAALDCIYKS